MKILVVDDSDFTAILMRELIQYMDVDMVNAKSGDEAVAIFNQSKEGEFDLIIMDIMMPDRKGTEVAREIRELNRKDAMGIPILALSSFHTEYAKESAKEAGMDDFIVKPITRTKMIEVIEKYRR